MSALNDLKKLAKACDVAVEKLETAKKWGGPVHVQKAQDEVDKALAAYDAAEAALK